MKYQKLLSYTRKAVDDYQMINEGDKIAIGISGGKDSLTLLYALKGLQRFYPNKFELEAITVGLGFDDFDTTGIKNLCEKLEVNYSVINTNIAKIIFEERKEKNPCSLCAKMRKGAFNELAEKLGCNKVAFGHHKDDIIATMIMSLIYEGRFYSFAPLTYLDRRKLYALRPLLYVSESEIISFTKQNNLPIIKSPCPANGYTKREYANQLIKQLNVDNPGVKDKFFTAISRSQIPGWSKEHD